MICPIMSYRERGYGSVNCEYTCAWRDKESGRCLIALNLEANLKNQQKEMTFSDYANMLFYNKDNVPIKEGDYIEF